ncbi:hypothetical protein [Candidatus Phyllobacterium onerii]|uniref:hypothetical protein n=1 Tax=Candidatus Phyllobacterium onerii TaxID=3020828 RepID=UPI00232C0BD8|nr:hypothetical protein [Phyllobacterium sp. IY22]
MLVRTKPVPVLCSAVLALGLVTMPYKVTLENHSFEFHTQSAWAKDGGGGANNGNGGGNSGNKGGNSGNAGGKGSNSGNGDKGGGSDNTSTSAGNSRNVQSGKVDPSTVAIDGSAMEVRHWNGMSEGIKDGRYVMKDAKGRTIINRTATTSDASRLRSFDR